MPSPRMTHRPRRPALRPVYPRAMSYSAPASHPTTYARTATAHSYPRPAEKVSYRSEVSYSTKGVGALSSRQKLEAGYLIGGGVVAAGTILLGYLGHRGAAAALGITGALTGALIGAVQLLGSAEPATEG